MTRSQQAVAVGIFGKTPAAGRSKTRLSPPLTLDQCQALSACFIRDMSATIRDVTAQSGDTGYAVYTPKGSETHLRTLLPQCFELLLQCDGDFGLRLHRATEDLCAAGYCGAILVNSDSPTLPASILRAAIDALKQGAPVVLGPALDGGYTLIGVSRSDRRLFENIPWSTADVYRRTMEQAAAAALPVVEVASWYDVDDAMSLRLLEAELAGIRPHFAQSCVQGEAAPATRALIEQWRAADRRGA